MAGPPRLAPEVNMTDVAHRADVSIATVSRALRGLPGVSDATRERVLSVAAELSYVVSPEASRLSRRETGRVAVVVPKIDNWFYSCMLAGIEETLRAADLDVLVYQVDGESQRDRFFQVLPARRKVDAVVLIALPLLPREEERLSLLGVEVVVAGGRLLDHPHVEVDDLDVADRVVTHLVDLGHRRIGMIRTSDTEGTTWSSDVLRTRGFVESMERHGLETPDELIVTRPYGVTAGAQAAAILMDLPDPPTAVFAYSDELAVSALRGLTELGVRVPDDVSLVGVDGHPLAELFGITSVDQSVKEQGHVAGALALRLMRGEAPDRVDVVVPVRLVVRSSSGPLRRRRPAPARG